MADDIPQDDTILWDWRDQGYLNPVRNQLNGNCCSVFAAIAAIENKYHKENEDRVTISPQDIYNHLIRDEEQNKKGISSSETLNWICLNGCVPEHTCPYVAGFQPPVGERQVMFRIETSKPLLPEHIEDHVRNEGPVMVTVDWIDQLDELQADEIYSGPVDAADFLIAEKHALLIVGFGTRRIGDKVTRFWIVRNSHGTQWANGGYAMVNREMIHGRYLLTDAWAPMGISFVMPV